MKLNTLFQNGRPLTARQSAILERNPRVLYYFTEAHDLGGRLISISLSSGYNYEQRGNFIAWDWAEVIDFLSRVEQGEPDPRNA